MAKGNKNYNKSGNRGRDNRCDASKQEELTPDKRKGYENARLVDEHFNDPDWYITDPTTAEAVASFPFGKPLGYSVDQGRGMAKAEWPVHPNDPNHALPGVVGFQWYPSIGDATAPASPVNMAAQGIYTFIRGKNSGAKNCEPSDIMIYLLAMDSIYTMYGVGMRLYGTMRMYSVQNRYLPKTLVTAQGFDFEDVKGRSAQIKGDLDILRARINQMAVPAHLKYFTRHFMLASMIFADAPIIKSAVYVPVPHFVWEYSGYTDRNGGQLLPVRWADGKSQANMTWADYMEKMERMVSRVTTDIDTGIISGDILKAYDTKIYQLPALNWDYEVQPKYDTWMLEQIHNAVLNNDPIINEDNPVTYIKQSIPDDPSEGTRLITQYIHESSVGNASAPVLIDVMVNQPTPKEFIEYSRFVNVQAPYLDTDRHRVLQSGSEIATVAVLYRLDIESDSLFTYLANSFMRLSLASANASYNALRALADISSVDKFPIIVVSGRATDDGNIEYVGTFGVHGNPINVTGDNLLAINNMAFMKLLM